MDERTRARRIATRTVWIAGGLALAQLAVQVVIALIDKLL